MSKNGNIHDNRYKIHEVKSLKKMPFPDLARDLLERLVLATQPLMLRQQWRVGQLMEFYPKNGGLLGLNVNAGSRIMIRLRSPHNQQTFLPFESLLGTMVHELVHNAIGEHSFDFYQLVDRLTDEVQRDMHQMRLSGLNPYEVKSAAPFDWSKSQGRKLGSALTGSSGCGSIHDYLLNATSTATTATTSATPTAATTTTSRGKQPSTRPPTTQPTAPTAVPAPPGSGTGAKLLSTVTTVTTTGGPTVAVTNTASADWIRQQRLQALARQGITEVFNPDRPTRLPPPSVPSPSTRHPQPPTTGRLPVPSSQPIVLVDLPSSASRPRLPLTQPLTQPLTVILDDGNATPPRIAGTKRSRPTPLLASNATVTITSDDVIDLSSSPPLSRTNTHTASGTASGTGAAVNPTASRGESSSSSWSQPIDLLDDDGGQSHHHHHHHNDEDQPDTQPFAFNDEEEDIVGVVQTIDADNDAVLCAPCTPLVIDLIALGLDDDDGDDGDDDDRL